MKKNMLIITLLILFVGLFNNAQSENNSENIVRNITIKDSTFIQTDTDIASVCCNDSLIFISTIYDGKIRCYGFDGKKKYSFARKGPGPGEFSHHPASLSIWNDYLISADTQNFELEFFKLNGEHFKTISYRKFMISPVSKLVPWQDEVIIEGTGVNMDDGFEMTQAVLTMNNDFKIKEKSSETIRKMTSMNPVDLLKKTNPFRVRSNYFRVGDSLIKYLDNEGKSHEKLILYNKNEDSTLISLNSIKERKVTKSIKEYTRIKSKKEFAKRESFFKNLANEDDLYKFPKYFPKVKKIYKIKNKILLLSNYQKINNDMNNKNAVYIWNNKDETFYDMLFNNSIPVNKIIGVNKDKMILRLDKKIKIITFD